MLRYTRQSRVHVLASRPFFRSSNNIPIHARGVRGMHCSIVVEQRIEFKVCRRKGNICFHGSGEGVDETFFLLRVVVTGGLDMSFLANRVRS